MDCRTELCLPGGISCTKEDIDQVMLIHLGQVVYCPGRWRRKKALSAEVISMPENAPSKRICCRQIFCDWGLKGTNTQVRDSPFLELACVEQFT